MKHKFKFIIILLILGLSINLAAQTGHGWLKGVVTDPSGAVVVGAAVTVTSPTGQSFTAESNSRGIYEVRNLEPGKYNMTVTAKGFSPYQLTDVVVPAEGQTLDAQLDIEAAKQQVTVEDQGTDVEVNASHNASQTVIKGKDLEALSDDPDELQSELDALAGPSAGPNGGQIYIDGFTNGQLPPKSAIREIRINQNPFSAQFDSLGYGRVEVFTKPGSDKFHGQFMFMDNNSVLNTKSPLVIGSAPDYNTRMINANFSGPINKRASFFFGVQQRNIDNVSVINALYDPATGEPLSTTVGNPHSRTSINPRIDYQLSTNNTLTARYEFERDNEDNNGISTYTLPSLAYNSRSTEHTFQVSDTQVLSPRVINETRFQYIREESNDLALNNSPSTSVPGAFTSGGNGIGISSDINNRYELQNYTSMALGKHFIKYGGRLRVSRETDVSTGGFNGAWTFNSLADYQAGVPSQFSEMFGIPSASVSYVDLGVYAEDDWRIRPNFTLSYGLRFESQNDIGDHGDWAPRIGFAWGLGSSKGVPKTVLRAGFGIFYDRFSQSLLLNTIRQNGVNQVQYIVSCDVQNSQYTGACPLAGLYPNVPDQSVLSESTPTIRKIAPNLRAPYTMQTAVTLERQLTKSGTASITYLNSRGEHTFLSQNINAPVVYDPNDPCANRPLGTCDNVYQYESAGIFRQNQLIANVRMNTAKFSLFSFYMLNYANSNTSGAGSFPSDPYNLMSDYGRASFSTRNRFVLGGSFNAPYHFTVSPFIIANSGRPYNITIGKDLNGDSIYNDRPAFANGVSGNPLVAADFNPSPTPGEALIPVNYGTGPASFTVNMRFAKVFGFGKEGGSGGGMQSGGGGGDHHHGPGGFGRGGGHGPWGGGGGTSRRYNLTVSLHAMNLFNRLNYGTPVATLTSPDFGISKSLSGGPFGSDVAVRRFFLQAQFSF